MERQTQKHFRVIKSSSRIFPKIFQKKKRKKKEKRSLMKYQSTAEKKKKVDI